MTLTKRMLFVLSVISAVTVILISVNEGLKFYKNSRSLRDEHRERIAGVYNKVSRDIYYTMKNQVSGLKSNRRVTEAIIKNDRGTLLSLASGNIEYLRSYFPEGRITLNFYDSKGNVILRGQNPKLPSVNVIPFRPMVGFVVQTEKTAYGLETCVATVSYRYISPVFSRGRIAGAVEAGIDMSSLAKKVAGYTGAQPVIILEGQTLKKLSCSKMTDKKLKYYNGSVIPFEKMPVKALLSGSLADINYKHQHYEVIGNFRLMDFSGHQDGRVVFLSPVTLLQKDFVLSVFGTICIIIVGAVVNVLVAKHFLVNKIKILEESYASVNSELIKKNTELQTLVNEEVKKNMEKDELIHQQQKVVDLGRMFSAIAHHWRQPINAIGLHVQDIGESYTSGEINEGYVKDFVKNNMELIKNLSVSIDKFSSFFKPSNEKTVFMASAVIRDLVNMTDPIMSAEHIDVVCECWCGGKLVCGATEAMYGSQCSATRLEGYEDEFKQVMLNILYNAIDAIKERYEKEKISENYDGQIKIRLEAVDGKVAISVTDNGCGISDAAKENMFNPYFTTKAIGKGVGLGLYMVKTVIEKYMKGRITAESGEGKTTFTVILDNIRTSK